MGTEKIKSGEFKFKKCMDKPVTVTWHDSCHIGRASGVYDPPRDVIKAIPGVTFVEMSSNREKAHCCGSVLTLLKELEVAADIGKIRLDEAIEAPMMIMDFSVIVINLAHLVLKLPLCNNHIVPG